jgi:hypothetical protein
MKQEQKQTDWLNIGLWAVKFAVLFTSARHVAEAFLSLERVGTHAMWGWIPALATDGGLLFMAWKLKSDSKSKVLWGGFLWFLIMSAFAQIDHAIQNVTFTGDNAYDGWQVVKIGLFAFSLPFLVAFMVVVASKRQPATTEPGTGLSTTNNHQQPAANHQQQPTVNVSPPPQQAQQQMPQRYRRRNLKPATTRPALVGNMPTMERLEFGKSQQPAAAVGNNTHENHQQPANSLATAPTTTPQQQPIMGLAIPPTKLDDLLAQAVVVYQGVSSYDKAGARLGVSGEMVRKRVLSAWEQDPAWVAQILPPERLPK